MGPRPQQFRHFSTVTRVYPPYLPYLHTSRRLISRRWYAPTSNPAQSDDYIDKTLTFFPIRVAPAVAIVAVGAGIATLRQIRREQAQRLADAARADAEAARRRNKVLLDAYSDRSSIEELEAAVQVYETQRRS